jgi:hypothetical protein
MNNIIVNRDSWVKCFSREYALTGQRSGVAIKETLAEKYGIEHWSKINLDEFRITFTDEKKKTYWALMWL